MFTRYVAGRYCYPLKNLFQHADITDVLKGSLLVQFISLLLYLSDALELGIVCFYCVANLPIVLELSHFTRY